MPEMHEAEARKLDRQVFGENGHDGVARLIADAMQRSHNGHKDDEGASGENR